MKYLITLIACLAMMTSKAQNCSNYYPTEVGKKLVYHQLDKRENLKLITSYEIVNNSGSGLTVALNLKDDRNEQITDAIFKAVCEDGNTSLDPESIMSSYLQQYEGLEYSITGDAVSIPNTLEVGQELPNTEITMTVKTGIMDMTSTVTMLDRKVARQEQVTTPAGTFSCYVITYTNKLKMGLTKTMQSTQWVAEGIGMVKEETYKANGRLLTKTILQQMN